VDLGGDARLSDVLRALGSLGAVEAPGPCAESFKMEIITIKWI
jgi:hypothetical protein